MMVDDMGGNEVGKNLLTVPQRVFVTKIQCLRKVFFRLSVIFLEEVDDSSVVLESASLGFGEKVEFWKVSPSGFQSTKYISSQEIELSLK